MNDTKQDMLWYFVNKLGCQDMLVAYTVKNNKGDLIWSHWLNYFELLHMDFEDIIPNKQFPDGVTWRDMTRGEFMDRVNQRSVLDCELMIDIDDCLVMKELFIQPKFAGTKLVYFDEFNKSEWFDIKDGNYMYPEPVFKDDLSQVPHYHTIRLKSQQVVSELKEHGKKPSVWFTGSKSYHISVIVPFLRDLTPFKRQQVRKDLVWYYGGDLQECHDRAMISLEYSIHHKSGIEKHEVELI